MVEEEIDYQCLPCEMSCTQKINFGEPYLKKEAVFKNNGKFQKWMYREVQIETFPEEEIALCATEDKALEEVEVDEMK